MHRLGRIVTLSGVPGSCQIEEVSHDGRAVLGEDALRMELDPMDRERAVGQPHDQPIAGFGRDVEIRRTGGPVDDQGMITRGAQGAVDAPEDSASLMVDLRYLPVHRGGRSHDRAAENLSDGLQPEADAEYRD